MKSISPATSDYTAKLDGKDYLLKRFAERYGCD